MIAIRLSFKASGVPDVAGELMLCVVHERSVRRLRSGACVFDSEWDECGCCLVDPSQSARGEAFAAVRADVEWEISRLRAIAEEAGRAGLADVLGEVVRQFRPCNDTAGSVFNFVHAQVERKRRLGRVRTAETYKAALNSFMRFRRGRDLAFDALDADMIELYESWLLGRGLVRNTSSFYMRTLRTNYLMAVEQGLTADSRPFRRVYCGIDRTVKRSLAFADIKRMKNLDLTGRPSVAFARDMFLLSFCLRGMSFVDMAYLRKADLRGGRLTYRRKKTGQTLTIEWTAHMQAIVGKYKSASTQYLLPIIKREDGTERRQYMSQQKRVNRLLGELAAMLHMRTRLTMYCSRHSWATIARGKSVPIAVISEGLGHDSEATTQIYLDSIKTSQVDRANRMILRGL